MENETIADIVREMRDATNSLLMNAPAISSMLGIFSDRIEAAAKREPLYNLCENLSNENDRLRAALKPVLECDIDTHPCDGYCVMLNAVREAQRIAMEGDNNG